MDFGSVYGSLLEIFPQIDTRILKAVAVEHPNDADEAAAVVLSEIIPSLPSNEFTQSQNKSKRERKLERELSDIAAKSSARSSSSSGAIPMSVAPSHSFNAPSTGLNVASASKPRPYPLSSGTIRMSVPNNHNFNASSTGLPHSKLSPYPISGTVPMGGAFNYNFNAPPSTGFHVAPNAKSSAYPSSSGTTLISYAPTPTPIGVAPTPTPIGVAPTPIGVAPPSTAFHFASGSKSSVYPSSPGAIPSVVARSHNLNAPSTGFRFASDSKSSTYSSSPGAFLIGVAPSQKLNGPSTGFHVASVSKSSAYPSSSGKKPMGFAPSLSVNALSTGLVLNKKELTNPQQNVGRDGFVAPREEVESFPEKAYEKEQEKSKITMTCSPGTVPTGCPLSFTSPTTNFFSNWDDIAMPSEEKFQTSLDQLFNCSEPEFDGTASVVSPITKEHIEPNGLQKLVDLTTPGDNTTNIQQGCSEMESASTNIVDETSNGDNEQDAHVLLNLNDDQSGEMIKETKGDRGLAKLSDDKESSMESDDDDDKDSLLHDNYLSDYCNIKEPNQQESAGELTSKATLFRESTTIIGLENAVDSITAGNNMMNFEEDLGFRFDFDFVPASTNVVDEASHGDTEIDCALDSSTNGFDVVHLDEIIEDAKCNKKALATAMESVTNLMREVELQEKDAEKTKEEATKGGLETLEKVEELKKMLKHAKEANDMHAGEVYGERSILATEVKELENRLVYLSENRNKSLAVLDEMRGALEVRLERAMEMKKIAEEEKKEKEVSAFKLLAEQEALMEKVVEESKLLQQEAEENSKLREFLMDRGQIVDSLQGEISVICEDVKMLKEKFENRVSSLTKTISSLSETSSTRGSSSMSSSFVREDPEESLSIDTKKETVEDSVMIKEKKDDEDWDIFDKEFDEFVVW